jgi:nitrite reductase (NADH) small subunit
MHDVGVVEDFPEGEMTLVTAGRFELGIVRWRDDFYAVRNLCPHMGAPLCAGIVGPCLTGTAELGRDLHVDRDVPIIVCPWHHWEYDASTGRSLVGKLRAQTYPVTVTDGHVVVDDS